MRTLSNVLYCKNNSGAASGLICQRTDTSASAVELLPSRTLMRPPSLCWSICTAPSISVTEVTGDLRCRPLVSVVPVGRPNFVSMPIWRVPTTVVAANAKNTRPTIPATIAPAKLTARSSPRAKMPMITPMTASTARTMKIHMDTGIA
ncbi:Uncharacterised protein [Mycobacteroides abscessus subsp. abscessus]|nr:Uncharacterised protein [Mycobacteroides abscessus subsp. abscessus]